VQPRSPSSSLREEVVVVGGGELVEEESKNGGPCEDEGTELSKVMLERQVKRGGKSVAEKSVRWQQGASLGMQFVSSQHGQYGANSSASGTSSLAISRYTDRAAASAALLSSLTDTAHENNFFWLEKYCEAQLEQEAPGASYNSAGQAGGANQLSILVDRLNRTGGDLSCMQAANSSATEADATSLSASACTSTQR
jgi:hypothetical protein